MQRNHILRVMGSFGVKSFLTGLYFGLEDIFSSEYLLHASNIAIA